MKRNVRALASLALPTLLAAMLASCGSGTGEGPSAASATPATPAPTQQAIVAQALILQGDTVRGPTGLTDEEKAFLSCVQLNRFPQGSEIVWRYKVFEPITDKSLDDKQITSFVLTLPDGKTQNFKYGPHPQCRTDDYLWTSSFKVPSDYPTGAFTYKAVATSNQGLTGSYEQFKVASAMLQIIPLGKR